MSELGIVKSLNIEMDVVMEMEVAPPHKTHFRHLRVIAVGVEGSYSLDCNDY